MAAKEPYDYLPTKVADKAQTLTLAPQNIWTQIAKKNVVIHPSPDGAYESRINLSGTTVFVWFLVRYDYLNESDAGIVQEFWYDENYGNGMTYTFYFNAPDSHTYVVRFDCDFEEAIYPEKWAIPLIKFRVLGKVVDS